ncbi:helix-turn-helix domain-containing protein [Thioclava indica]|uniref:HTH cro/C1-type domain-containing protein n=1 Tax=Thioclava indica TaxID=1353528 RepID=A0A074KB14_9RHOB|nr:helix-turn-helix domain-containing protein [Thioclava indica]KEO58727.1 hypothetical protein DT23_16050 [Thioclava indica]
MSSLQILKDQRRALGLSQAQVAKRAGISIPTLRELENGQGTIRSLTAVLTVLDLRWAWAPSAESAGDVLCERRKALGISQAEMARRVGCSRITIMNLEKTFVGRVPTLLKMLAALRMRKVVQPIGAEKGRPLSPASNGSEQDIVMTPPALARAIIGHFSHAMSGRILDPSRGEGAFYNQFPSHLERDWCEVSAGRNFFAWGERVDWVMTNPPWSQIRAFTQHAMRVADNIVWLAPLTNITTKARLRDLEEHGFGVSELLFVDTPKGDGWPQSGFQIVAAHLSRGYRGDWRVGRL